MYDAKWASRSILKETQLLSVDEGNYPDLVINSDLVINEDKSK